MNAHPYPLANPVEEALRYIANARTLLSTKAGKEGDLYSDPKYVRMAGNTAYNGVLVALDSLIPAPAKGRKSVEHYQKNIKDGKLLKMFNTCYTSLHLSMGYDGNLSYGNAQDGLRLAEQIIDYVSIRTNFQPTII